MSTRPQPSASSEQAAVVREYRSRTTLAAFVVGLPLAAGLLYLIYRGPLREHALVVRYTSHPVECVELVAFCMAVGALGAKLLGNLVERWACRAEVLPPWDGQAVPVSQAQPLLAQLGALPRRLQQTLLVRRAAAVLDFVRRRGSAAELDDQLRALADNDALALESSYALVRFITWAIPILGFLGTVLGITEAIAGVTPEVLEQSLSTVTDGLALAFDTTALALTLTMATMFVSFLAERGEQSVLDRVDRYIDRELAHRFERTGSEGGEFVEVVRRNTDVLVQAMGALTEKQASIWARALDEAERRRAEAEKRQQDRLAAGLEAALDRTLEAHARRLAALEKQTTDQGSALLTRLETLAQAVRDTAREQQAGMTQIAQALTAQVEALARLQEGETQLLRLQESLEQNLTALAGAGAFEQAVHSLTAAIHLLTAGRADGGQRRQGPPRLGAAA